MEFNIDALANDVIGNEIDRALTQKTIAITQFNLRGQLGYSMRAQQLCAVCDEEGMKTLLGTEKEVFLEKEWQEIVEEEDAPEISQLQKAQRFVIGKIFNTKHPTVPISHDGIKQALRRAKAAANKRKKVPEVIADCIGSTCVSQILYGATRESFEKAHLIGPTELMTITERPGERGLADVAYAWPKTTKRVAEKIGFRMN